MADCSCSGTCWGSCKWDCLGCSGCSGCSSCKGTCKGTCTASCSTACNTTCSGATQTTNLEKLVLNETMKKEDITNIETAVKFEVVDRRGKTLTNQDIIFLDKEAINAEKVNKIITNLKQTGQTPLYNATAGELSLKVLAEDLIAKIIAANKVTINLPL